MVLQESVHSARQLLASMKATCQAFQQCTAHHLDGPGGQGNWQFSHFLFVASVCLLGVSSIQVRHHCNFEAEPGCRLVCIFARCMGTLQGIGV